MRFALAAAASTPALAQDTIKVGVLHSLSGTIAISETTLKDVMLMLVEEQNKIPDSRSTPVERRWSGILPRAPHS